jgi:hypothetical protein
VLTWWMGFPVGRAFAASQYLAAIRGGRD